MSACFTSSAEARALWDRLLAGPGSPAALVLMPNHVHALVPQLDERAFSRALSGYARWRNHHRGASGPVWERHPPPHAVPDQKHLRRTLRYIHLNPCRAGLVHDPLAWPFSTHRDACGLAKPTARERMRDPHAFHAYVSADPTVSLEGTLLPARPYGSDAPPLTAVLDAASSVTRTPLSALVGQRSPARSVALSAARALAIPTADLAAAFALHPSAVRRTRCATDELVARVLFDDRFPGLLDGDLRRTRSWRTYASHA